MYINFFFIVGLSFQENMISWFQLLGDVGLRGTLSRSGFAVG